MVTLVTGASRGIGKSIAVRLAETRDTAVRYNESADAATEVVDVAEERGTDAVSVQADVSDSAATRTSTRICQSTRAIPRKSPTAWRTCSTTATSRVRC